MRFHNIPIMRQFFLLALCAVISVTTPAQSATQAPHQNLETIRAILEMPDDQIDLAKAKLTIDRMIDPGIDIESNLKRLDSMAHDIRAMLPANPSSLQTMETLVRYLYVAGPWNDNRPYRYDLADPFGKNIRNKLLPVYLTTRRGNCISMPFLFIALGKKLGLDVTASTTPRHVLVKYRLDEGQYRNFEAVSGGPKLESSYRRDMPMTDRALANGVYLQPLSKREAVAVMAGALMEFYGQKNLQEQRIALANLLLKYYPKDETAMMHQSTAYRDLIDQEFANRYRSPADIPPDLYPRYLRLKQNMELWLQRAEAIGWRMPDQESENNYMKTIQRAKQANGEDRK